MSALAILNKQSIIDQVREGKHLKLIAQDFGITPGAISQYLSKDPEYRAARESGAETRLEYQYAAIEEASDQLNLARAREGFRAASWFAEREFPARWGAKQTVEHTGTVSIDFSQRLRQAERIIEGECSAPLLTDSTHNDVSD